MEECGRQPGAKACEKGNGKRKLPFEANEGDYIEEDAGENAPEGAFRKGPHNVVVALIVDVDPDEDERSGEGHDGDETCRGRKFFCKSHGGENNE